MKRVQRTRRLLAVAPTGERLRAESVVPWQWVTPPPVDETKDR
jgi:hypothetical protein